MLFIFLYHGLMLKSIVSKKLPNGRKFKPKTILVISAHTIARVCIIEKDNIQELKPLHTEATEYNYTDKEWFSYTHNGARTGWTITWFKEKNKMHYDNVFASFLVKEIKKLDKEQQAESIIIYAPEDLKKILTESFPKTYAKKLQIHMGNHIKISFPKLFDLLK